MAENNVQTIIDDEAQAVPQNVTEGTGEVVESNTTQGQEDIEQALKAAADELDEDENKEAQFHDWSTENVTVRALIKRYQEGKFKLPLCQRLYVWDEKKRISLYESIKQNLPCGTIIITEANSIQYLLDGLQRTTSLILLSNDKEKYTPEERKMIIDYKVTLTIVHDMSTQGMKNYFSVLNSGIALAAAVKERSKLSDDLNDAILQISSNEFFRTVPTSATFNKAHHHELIAMNTLLAVAGCEIDDNKAKSLCSRLTTYSEGVFAGIDAALSVVERIKAIYSELSEDIVKRSMNANFIGIFVYVMVKNQQFSNTNYVRLINYIFAEKRAAKEYSVTTTNGAGDANKCKARYDVLVSLLNNPVIKPLDEKAFQEFAKEQRGKMIKDATQQYGVAFEDFEECEQQSLFRAMQNGGSKLWNTLVEKKYRQLDKQGIKKNKRESA